MAKEKRLGCIGGLCLIGISTLVGYGIGKELGALIGGFIGLVWVAFILRKPKGRICEICGAPVIHTSYEGVINGKKFSVICAKCKNQLTGKKRKEALKELLNE